MKVESVRKVIQTLGAYDYEGKYNLSGTWLLASCTLAPYTHGGGRDTNPSCGYSTDEGMSFSICHSCGEKHSLKSLVYEHVKYGTIEEDTAVKLIKFIESESQERYDLDVKHYIPDIPSFLTDDFNIPHPYWESRGFDNEVVAQWKLGYSHDLERALIPFYDADGTLQAVYGRDVSQEQLGPKWKIYEPGFPRSKFLFGENFITGAEESILLVEGPPDVISAKKYLPPEIGVLGIVTAIPSIEQLRYILMTAKEVIIGLDRDGAGTKGADKAKKFLKNQCVVSEINYGDFKDANEAGSKILDMVSNRKDVRLDNLFNAFGHLTN